MSRLGIAGKYVQRNIPPARTIEQRLGLPSRAWAIALAFILLALVAYVDWITGPWISMIIFYLVPVALLASFVAGPLLAS